MFKNTTIFFVLWPSTKVFDTWKQKVDAFVDELRMEADVICKTNTSLEALQEKM